MTRSACIAVLLTLGPASAAQRPPPAAAADTFALDTHLRRNEYPLTADLIEYSGTGGRDVPVTMGLGCGEGDFAVGRLCPLLNGKPLPAQVDVLATWPGDGSIRHALVSLLVPEIGAGERLQLRFAAVAPPEPEPFAVVCPAGALSIEARLEDEDGTPAVSRISQRETRQMAAVLAGEAEAGEMAPRMAGPICYEFEIHDVPLADGAADPDIDLFYRVRFYSGWPGARVAWVVENTRIPAEPYPATFTVADRDFAEVTFEASLGEAAGEPVALGPVTQWYGTRYRILNWIGDRPPAVYAKESPGYLIHSQFFPKLDLENPVEGPAVDQALARFQDSGYDLAGAPLGRPLHHNHVFAYMPGTGGRPDIGAYATWHRLALASWAPSLHLMALAADGNSLASFPIHRREAGTLAEGAPYDAAVHQMLWDPLIRGEPGAVTYARSETECPQTPDYAHTPSAAFYSYLTTGDRFFEEELAFWAMYPSYVWPFTGIFPHTTRSQAWQLRNVTDAAFLLPDDHPRKAYLADVVERNIDALAQMLTEHGDLFTDRQRKCSGRLWYVCSNQVSTWQCGWLIWALDNAARKGFPAAAAVRDGAADILLRLYEGDEEFAAPNGKVYRWDPSYAMAYQVAVDLLQVEFLDDGTEKDTFLRDITGNTGEMYYYTMVNDCHKYWFGDPADYAAWKASLPRKVMRPEDWLLDEDLARQNRSTLPHEYGNAECSAALARYDNPRAWRMYDYVRGTMEGKPDRVRGIEYVR